MRCEGDMRRIYQHHRTRSELPGMLSTGCGGAGRSPASGCVGDSHGQILMRHGESSWDITQGTQSRAVLEAVEEEASMMKMCRLVVR